MLSEHEIARRVRAGEVSLPPLTFRLEKTPAKTARYEADEIISAWWDGREIGRFAVEYKSTASPKAIQAALMTVRGWRLEEGLYPLVMVPYLGNERLAEFEKEKISAVDLCGNGVVLVGQKLAVYRTGGRNEFTSSEPIKNVYRRNSSLVVRVFAAKPRFHAVGEVLEEINTRNGIMRQWNPAGMGLSTVSKVLKAMEEDLLIAREAGIRLIQPRKLLDKLAENYEPPSVKQMIRLKIDGWEGNVLERIRHEADRLQVPWQVTGLSSVNQFAVMQRGEMISVYCPRLKEIVPALKGRETDRFPNLEIQETGDQRVYFDPLVKDGVRWASSVQAYLELMSGDKRDRETAEQVRSHILKAVEEWR